MDLLESMESYQESKQRKGFFYVILIKKKPVRQNVASIVSSLNGMYTSYVQYLLY